MNELRDRVLREIRKVVVGQDHVVEVLLAATAVALAVVQAASWQCPTWMRSMVSAAMTGKPSPPMAMVGFRPPAPGEAMVAALHATSTQRAAWKGPPPFVKTIVGRPPAIAMPVPEAPTAVRFASGAVVALVHARSLQCATLSLPLVTSM